MYKLVPVVYYGDFKCRTSCKDQVLHPFSGSLFFGFPAWKFMETNAAADEKSHEGGWMLKGLFRQ